jgi:hypothetical protein
MGYRSFDWRKEYIKRHGPLPSTSAPMSTSIERNKATEDGSANDGGNQKLSAPATESVSQLPSFRATPREDLDSFLMVGHRTMVQVGPNRFVNEATARALGLTSSET